MKKSNNRIKKIIVLKLVQTKNSCKVDPYIFESLKNQ